MEERECILSDEPDSSSTPSGSNTTVHRTRCQLSSDHRRLVRTCCMVLFYITLGMYIGIMPPATLDLMEIFHCSIQSLSVALSFKAVGIMSGSLLGGVVVNRLRAHTDLALALISICAGSINAALPWCPSLVVFGGLLGVQGVMTGALNVVCNTVTLAEWKERSPAPMNALHMAYSVGLLIAPPSTAPFLSRGCNGTSEHNPHLHVSYGVSSSSVVIPNNVLGEVDPTIYDGALNRTTDSRLLFIPFTFNGGLGVVTGLLFLLFYCLGWKYQSASPVTPLEERSRNENSSINPTEEDTVMVTTAVHLHREKRLKIIMAIAMPITYFALVNKDNAINAFSFYIAVKSNTMEKSRALIFQLVYNASSVFGRLMGTVLGGLIDIHYLVFGALLASMADLLCLVFFGLDSVITFWTLTCGFAAFCGPCYASIMSWADRYTEMGGIMVSLVDIGVGTGAFMSMYLGGFLLNHRQPVDVFILATASSGMLILIMVFLQIVCYRKGPRIMGGNTDPSQPTENEEYGTDCNQIDSDRQNLINT